MNAQIPTRPSTALLATPGRGVQGGSLVAPVAPASWLGADVLLLLAAVSLSLSVLAAWLTSASLTTLVFFVACVPLALLFTAVLCRRAR